MNNGLAVQMRERVRLQGAWAETEVQTTGRPNVCQCEIRGVKRLWRTALCCCFRKRSGEKWPRSGLQQDQFLESSIPEEAL